MALTCAASASAQVKVIAHRGYWDTPGSAQNSIAALVKADSIGCYGSEFDVWLTADDRLMVFHDDRIGDRMIEQTTSQELRKHILANGEPIPFLEEYLDKAVELPNLRLILELKPHADKAREERAARMVIDMVAAKGLDSRTDYITFSFPAFGYFCYNSAEPAEVYYLGSDITPEMVQEAGGDGLDCSLGTMRRHSNWIDELHAMGKKVNIWTVNNPADMEWCMGRGADFITTNAPTVLQEIIKKYSSD